MKNTILYSHVRRALYAWLALATGAVAVGCSSDDAESPSVDAPVGNDGATADTAMGVTPLVFAPCAADPELECGQMSVPVDYRDPSGPQVILATVRAPALTSDKQGILFVNPGGPGGSGVDLVVDQKSWWAPLRQRFDVVSFDPRGIARSQSVDCDVEFPPPPASNAPEAMAAYLDDVGTRYAAACMAQHGALVTQVGTDNVARDIDAFRAALGEDEINYFGYSYGTALGVAYATLFPQRVRAMVLDGNAAPGWFSDYLLELDSDGSAAAELALRRLDQLCGAAADCTLRDRGVVATLDRVAARLDASPVFVTDGVITGAVVRGLVRNALTQETMGWPFVVQVITAADAGDYALIPPAPVDAGATQTLPNGFAVVCSDSTTRRTALDYLPAQAGIQTVFPRFGGANFGFAITACSAWPRSEAVPVENLRTRNGVVVIGNDFDSSTPLAWTRNMAAALGSKASLVRYQGGGHTVYGSGSACIDGAVEAYFADPTSPPRGLVCPAQQLQFGSARRVAQVATTPGTRPGVFPQAPRFPRAPVLPRAKRSAP